MTPDAAAEALKRRVQSHWEAEACGTRGIGDADRRAFFARIERERYAQEPYIPDFAGFTETPQRRVLEIGVGAGTDYVQWLRAGTPAVGIDLTWAALSLTSERTRLECRDAALARADCESLPFRDESFDLVYSHGVIHHSPDTPAAVREIHRVLRPGGAAKVMIYHAPSLTGLMLWGVHCLLKGRPWRSPRWAVSQHLESPGTKAYTRAEAAKLFGVFAEVRVATALLSGDLLLMRPSAKYQHPLARAAFRLYPRAILKRTAGRLGLALLIEAQK